MLLAIDVGNTNTVLGVFDGADLRYHWRVETNHSRTADEYGIQVLQLFASVDLPKKQVSSVVVSNVVPPLGLTFEQMSLRYFGRKPLTIGPGVKTGISVLYDNPREVGADRIVNAVAAIERWKPPLIVVDFGTATTFDAINAQGAYLGGAIAPGVSISMEALFQRASKLPRVEFARPPEVIGRNTISSIQSGLVFGYVGLVDGICARMMAELGGSAKVVATGGIAPLVADLSALISEVDEFLTLQGLRLIHERNL